MLKTAVDIFTRMAIMALPLFVAAAGMVGLVEGEIRLSGTCSAQWCANDRDNDALKAEVAALIAEQVEALGCDTNKRLSETVAVRNAKGFDRNVVRVITFDEAWEQAEKGQSWVVGYCG